MNLSAAKRALALLLPSLGMSAAYTPADCFAGFTALNFAGFDFARYDEFYDDNSTFTLAQTGVYTGADAIEEYVRFVTVDSPYFDNFERFEFEFFFSAERFDPIAGICVFAGISTQGLTYSAELTDGDTINYGAYRNIFYSIPKNKVEQLTLYYTADLVKETFNRLGTSGVRRFVCSVRHGPNCTAALGEDALTTQQRSRAERSCRKSLKKLPITEGDEGYADGNTQGCRALHADFAETNDFHCAHIALEPTPDPAGVIKCAVSEQVVPEAVFTQGEIDAYFAFCAASPFVDDDCIRIISSPSSSSKSKSSKKRR